jgi:hypothetical protein
MKTIHLKRSAVLVGLVGVAMGAFLLVPGAASADVPNPPFGQFNGGLTLSVTSGTGAEQPNWTAGHACPAGTANATLVTWDNGTPIAEQGLSNPVPGTDVGTAGFGNQMLFPMSLVPAIAGGTLPTQYEFAVDCHATAGVQGTILDYTIVNFAADGSWRVNSTAGPTATTTTLSATPSTVQVGGNVTLNATVSPAAAAGSVQFKDGSANLGSPVAVTSGAAQFSTTSLTAGGHQITAVFTPTDATAFSGSTSNSASVTVTSSLVQPETINVNIPSAEGILVLTVSSTPVQMSQAVLSADSTTFSSTGTLGDVTVSDGRNQSHPGWRVTGQVSDFTNGTNTIDGNGLGWTPSIKTPNAANDVVAGPAVAAGSNPGLKQGSGLASAAAAKGLGTTVLSAALSLTAPSSTAAGSYSATLTITAIPTA